MGLVSNAVLDQVAAEERIRQENIARAWRYYYGQMPQPLKVRKGQPDDNIRLNMCRPIVDKGVSFLFGQEIEIQVDPNEADTEPPEGTEADAPATPDEWLEKTWQQNGWLGTLSSFATMGGVTGHVFVRLMLPTARAPYPRLVLWDTGNVSVITDPEDYQHVVQYTNQWNAIDPDTGKPIVRRQMIFERAGGLSWLIRDEVSRADNARWQLISESAWPFPWPPVFHCQNLPAPNVFFGVSDLESDILAVNDGMNFIMSNMARIIRFHAHPRLWGRGFTSQTLDMAIDGITILPSANAELKALEMQSDLGSSLTYYTRIKEALHEMSRIPEIASGKLEGAGAFSGVALAILYQPLLEKTETKRRLYGCMIKDICARLLEIGGQGAEHEICIHWPKLLPSDPKADAETLTTESALGVVSKRTTAEKLGYDYDTEIARMEEEAQAAAEKAQQMFDRGLMPNGSPMPMPMPMPNNGQAGQGNGQADNRQAA